MIFLLIDMAHASGSISAEEIARIVGVQALNFFAFVGILAYFLRKKIKAYYSQRQSDFVAALEKAESVKREAELKRQGIQVKIEKIESGYDATMKKAAEKAEQNRIEIIEDAKRNAVSLKTEAENTSKTQVRDAVNNLKADLLDTSVASAEAAIQSKMQRQDHENIQDHLVKSFGAMK